jgi:hypothetical protein
MKPALSLLLLLLLHSVVAENRKVNNQCRVVVVLVIGVVEVVEVVVVRAKQYYS